MDKYLVILAHCCIENFWQLFNYIHSTVQFTLNLLLNEHSSITVLWFSYQCVFNACLIATVSNKTQNISMDNFNTSRFMRNFLPKIGDAMNWILNLVVNISRIYNTVNRMWKRSRKFGRYLNITLKYLIVWNAMRSLRLGVCHSQFWLQSKMYAISIGKLIRVRRR